MASAVCGPGQCPDVLRLRLQLPLPCWATMLPTAPASCWRLLVLFLLGLVMNNNVSMLAEE